MYRKVLSDAGMGMTAGLVSLFQFQIKDETKAVRIEATKAYT
jgi:hypothetical protein